MQPRTAIEIAQAVRGGSLTARDAVEHSLELIAARDGEVSAFLRVRKAAAREEADAVDAQVRGGRDPGPLAGVPVAVKDVFAVRGEVVSAGSRVLESYVSPFDSTHVARLRAAGAIVVGHTTMDEFAMGSSSENTPHPVVRNPWHPERVAGGSSGGSAAAVASGMVAVALGTDTGGSIRQPASFCNLVGVKPSYGRVSRHGMVAFASSLDQAGPLTHTVADAARVLEVLAGADERDATCWSDEVPNFEAACAGSLQGLRVGVHRAGLEHEGLDPAVRARMEEALAGFRDAGAQLVDVELPHAGHAVATYYVLAPAEAASNLARYDGVTFGRREVADTLLDMYRKTRSEGFGEEVQRRILLGTFVLRKDSYDAYYGRAQRVRQLIARDYETCFTRCEVLASPVAPTAAFARGEKTRDPMAMYLSDIYTLGASLAGVPACSVPAGFVDAPDGLPLPVGLGLAAARGNEVAMFRAAAGYEARTRHHQTRPGGTI